ncbi:MAG: iron-containing alcohol dehydrogenase, partial [Armatimonadota bacterium]
MYFELSAATKLVFGEGTFGQIGTRAAQYGRKAFLVTGRSALIQSGHVRRATDLLAAAGVEVELFARIPSNPIAEIVDEGAAACRAAGCDVV